MNLSPSSLGLATPSLPALPGGSAAGALAKPGGFAGVWARAIPGAQPSPPTPDSQTHTVEVQQGDTLIGLVKAHYRQQGLPIGEGQAYRLAHQVAADNGIANPDLIVPGQQVDFARLQLPALARTPADNVPWGTPGSTAQALASRTWATPTPVPAQLRAQSGAFALNANDQDHPVLDSTLARAVDKGYVPASDLPAVRNRVLALADRYRFAPDDFARLTLMESGMNPQASNGSCHGIIQFCDGPGRGAAAVGMRNNPRAILGMGMLQQLDLVDRYFAHNGLGQGHPAAKLGLDDLYLTVLTPAARSEQRRHVALDIAGPQASYLHVDRDRQKPITRDSIVQGLYAYTNQLLQTATGTARKPQQQYAQNAGSTAP
jgi:hypothetical protein